jgi:hypothetical protein
MAGTSELVNNSNHQVLSNCKLKYKKTKRLKRIDIVCDRLREKQNEKEQIKIKQTLEKDISIKPINNFTDNEQINLSSQSNIFCGCTKTDSIESNLKTQIVENYTTNESSFKKKDYNISLSNAEIPDSYSINNNDSSHNVLNEIKAPLTSSSMTIAKLLNQRSNILSSNSIATIENVQTKTRSIFIIIFKNDIINVLIVM